MIVKANFNNSKPIDFAIFCIYAKITNFIWCANEKTCLYKYVITLEKLKKTFLDNMKDKNAFLDKI